MLNLPNLSQFAGCKTILRQHYRDSAEKEAFRDLQLHRLILHAYTNVTYYRQLLDNAGLTPDDIQRVADLSAHPISCRKDLQGLTPDHIVAGNFEKGRLIVRRTSGSSGEPFAIRRTWFEERLLQSFRRRAMSSFGQRMTDRVASIARVRPRDPNDHQFLLRIANTCGFYRDFRIDCLLPIEEVLRQLARVRADVVVGFPGVLFQVAQTIIEQRHEWDGPRFVVTGGEVLTPHMLRCIATAFGARVFDTYGSHEFNLIAWECSETAEYHLCDDSLIVEVLKNGRPVQPGEQGELVITSLFSYAMPIIRYRLADQVTQGSEICSCAHRFSTIKEIRGRMIDYLSLSDGRKIHPYEIIKLLVREQNPWVRQYQLIQESENRIILKVVPMGTDNEAKTIEIQKKVSNVLGNHVDFRIDEVDKIENEPSGKFRVSWSQVSSAYDI